MVATHVDVTERKRAQEEQKDFSNWNRISLI